MSWIICRFSQSNGKRMPSQQKDQKGSILRSIGSLDEPVFFKDRDADTNGSQEPKHISSLTATDTWEHHWTALQRIAEGRVLFKAPMPMQLRTRALHILQPISSNVLDGSCTMLHLQLNLANTVSARIILHRRCFCLVARPSRMHRMQFFGSAAQMVSLHFAERRRNTFVGIVWL